MLVPRPQNFASRDRCFWDGSRDASEEMDKAIQELSVFTADYFSVDCQKLKPRPGQSGQNPVHQSEVDVNTCNRRKAREKRVRANKSRLNLSQLQRI